MYLVTVKHMVSLANKEFMSNVAIAFVCSFKRVFSATERVQWH